MPFLDTRPNSHHYSKISVQTLPTSCTPTTNSCNYILPVPPSRKATKPQSILTAAGKRNCNLSFIVAIVNMGKPSALAICLVYRLTQTSADPSRAYYNWIDDSGNNNDAAYYQAPGFEYAFQAPTGHHAINVGVQHMEPFERLLSLHTSGQWTLDQIPWQATYPETSSTSQSSRSLYCNPADLLPRTSSAPPPASHTTPEPDGPGVHRTASTSIKTARRSNVTKGAPHTAPLERPMISLEGRTATTGRTARKHKLYLSVSTPATNGPISLQPRNLS